MAVHIQVCTLQLAVAGESYGGDCPQSFINKVALFEYGSGLCDWSD